MDGILISHAHLDHSGCLIYVMEEAGNVPFYATKETKELIRLRLLWVKSKNTKIGYTMRNKIKEEIKIKVDKIQEKEYFGKIKGRDYKIELYNSGHMLGSAMYYICTNKEKTLFTGDFNNISSEFKSAYYLPTELEVDNLICESTYICKSSYSYEKYKSNIENLEKFLIYISEKNEVCIKIKRIDKEYEILEFIIGMIKKNYLKRREIFLSEDIYENFIEMTKGREELRKRVCKLNLAKKYILIKNKISNGGRIVLTEKEFPIRNHVDAVGISNLIEKIKPKRVIFVHGNKYEQREKINEYRKQFKEIEFLVAENEKIIEW